MTTHLMGNDLLPACEAPAGPDGITTTPSPSAVDCNECCMGTWYRYENGEVHNRPDVYGDTGPSSERLELPTPEHNTWSWGCAVPTSERRNGDGLDASAICPTCEHDEYIKYGLWGG